MDAPGEAIALGGGVNLVLLGVVEVGDLEPGLLFAQRRKRKRSGTDIGVEWPEVMLQPGDERHMLDAARERQRREQVADHAAIDFDVLRLGSSPRPGRDVDMRRLQALERLPGAFGIEQVSGYVVHVRHQALGVARQAVDFGAATDQFLTGAATGDACGSDDECDNIHGFLLMSPVRARDHGPLGLRLPCSQPAFAGGRNVTRS